MRYLNWIFFTSAFLLNLMQNSLASVIPCFWYFVYNSHHKISAIRIEADSFNTYKLQEDQATVVQKEKEKQSRTEKLKNSASYLLDRLDEIGLPALLEDDDGHFGRTEERPIERVNATDLLDAVKNK